MREPKPKFLVKNNERWLSTPERATNTGEWPFEQDSWRMIFYPYTHDGNGTLIWLEPDIEHIHAFTQQNVKMQHGSPIYNPETMIYDGFEEMPFCLLCGVFMQNLTWDHFMRCKELVRCSIQP